MVAVRVRAVYRFQVALIAINPHPEASPHPLPATSVPSPSSRERGNTEQRREGESLR